MGRESLKNKSETKRIEERKNDHLRICLEEDVEAKNVATGFEDVLFVHRALPEINWNEIELSIQVLNHKFSAPLIVEGMTGGTEQAFEINSAVAQAVEEYGIGMGVGSQRAALENPKLERTFAIARKKAPTAFIIANIGGSQIVKEYDLKKVKKAIEMIEADALAIHLNPLQEAVQPEGETHYSGILEKIEEISNALMIPVIVKETGAGIAAEDARKMHEIGVSAIDIAGAGGTSWAAVEYHRAKQRGDLLGQEIGSELWDWGIPTAISLVEVVKSAEVPVIASGGVRSGKDASKALALGADLAGFALPILGSAFKGSEEVKKQLGLILHQLRTVMFLVGADTVKKLQSSPIVIVGKTAEWLKARGFEIETYARRRS